MSVCCIQIHCKGVKMIIEFIETHIPHIIIFISMISLFSGIAGCIAYKHGYADGIASERARLSRKRERNRRAYHECAYRNS